MHNCLIFDLQPGNAAWKLWYFSKDIKDKDIVVAYGDKSILDIGQVEGKCHR